MNILITGGSSGLGKSVIQKLANHKGVEIYFTYFNSLDAAKQLEEIYPNVHSIKCNYSDIESVNHLVSKIDNLNLDVLVNNAWSGIYKEHFHKMDIELTENSFEINIIPTLKITQEAIKKFRKKKFGKIINIISSVVINKPPIGWSGYAAEKSYLLSMSKSWATENIRFNITSNSISPSFMVTNLTSDTDERIVEQILLSHPLKKLLTTDEVAESVLFFMRASQQINGTNIVINAGNDII